ncbi:LytR family transcriptional regulator [Rhodococcus rhodnii]|uniref:LytR family transcriptional regulator n=1 Tax=Rhodococcus rhodnii TaxID=38312 RepID=A0A6P2C8Y0_9NOCA|nr:LCP family protein [Rhodococcus rhodnii]TXG89093.1 LytR family transcriptional regulator [Rhodococcus rhodnii]
MGDDRDEESPAPDSRAPWERPLARRDYRESRPPGHVPPAHRRHPEPTGDPYDPDRTEVIEPVAATPPPPAAVPQAVGATRAARSATDRRRSRKRMRVLGRTLVTLASIVALAATGTVWGYLRATEGKLSQVSALDTESDDIVDALGQLGDETYLVVGTDTRAGASGEIGAGTVDDAGGARADTVILVNIPADRSRVVAVSFPRDLDVERPQCEGWDNDTGTYTGEMFDSAYGDKLNATYALGGPKCLVKVIQKMSGLKIGHFVGMDFAGFETMVDQIGGVDVCTTAPLVDGILGTIIADPGNHRLEGRRALDYVRARHIEAEGNSDYGRITRQQKFLSSLLREALSGRVLLNPGKLGGLVDAFTRETFVENIDTRSLLSLARSLQNVDAGAVTFLTVPTAGTNDWGNEIPRTDDIDAIFRAIIDDAPLPGEERAEPIAPPADAPAEAPTAVEALDPSEVSVQVSNASGISGSAATTADSLAVYGYQILSVGNYTETTYDTLVRFSPGNESEAATVASSIPGAVLESAPGLGGSIEVVLGSGAPASINAPAVVGTPLDATPQQIGSAPEIEIPSDLAVVNAGDTTCT